MGEPKKIEMLVATVKTRAYASRRGFAEIDERLGENRRLYNAALEHRRAAYKRAGDSVSLKVQSREFTLVRKDDPDGFGSEERRIAIGTLKRLDGAFKRFFKRAKAGERKPGYPRFKGPARFRTLEAGGGGSEPGYMKTIRRYDPETGKGTIRIKGLPAIRFRDKRIPVKNGEPVQPKEIRITRTARLMHVSMVFETEPKREPSDSQPENPVGIDMGVNKRAALSDGTLIPAMDGGEGRKRKARAQRALARKRRKALNDRRADWRFVGMRRNKSGAFSPKYRLAWRDGAPSRGYRKARARLQSESYRQSVATRQLLHQLATAIVKRYDFIAVEDLEIQNMTRSAKGTLDAPGKGVAQKRGLNRGILEQNWGQFLDILEQKAERAAVRFVKVNPRNTSRECSACGVTDKRSRKGESYSCVHCGYHADADINAAANIEQRGLKSAGFSPCPEPTGRRRAIQVSDKRRKPPSDDAKSARLGFQPPLLRGFVA